MAVSRPFAVTQLTPQLGRATTERLSLFVHYDVGERTPTRGILRTSRFWLDRHAELDDMLASLGRRGVLCDGIATAGDPVEALARTLVDFHPEQIVLASSPRLRRRARHLTALFASSTVGRGRPIPVVWFSA
jgi:hypothetical protein